MQKPIYLNPGCALSIYKENKEAQLLALLQNTYPNIAPHKICCHHQPKLPTPATIINVCAGCDKRFSTLYPGIDTLSVWEVLDDMKELALPDYQGLTVSIQDPCPIRHKPQVHQAIRSLLQKMNIQVIEHEYHSGKSRCCGDSYYPARSITEIHQKMHDRAQTMPCENVVAYCVSCIKAMHIGGKTPRYMIDLLFHEKTTPDVYDTLEWHQQLQDYIDQH